MAKLLIGYGTLTGEGHDILAMVAAALPDEWKVVEHAKVPGGSVRAVDALIVTSSFVAAVTLLVSTDVLRFTSLSTLVEEMEQQAETLSAYLRDELAARAVFGDQRLARALQVVPVLLVPPELENVDNGVDVAVAILTIEAAPDRLLEWEYYYDFEIRVEERARLARLFLLPPEEAGLRDEEDTSRIVDGAEADRGNDVPPERGQQAARPWWRAIFGLPRLVERWILNGEDIAADPFGNNTGGIAFDTLEEALHKRLEATRREDVPPDILVHNYFTLYLAEEDYAAIQEFEGRFRHALETTVERMIKSRDYTPEGEVTVTLAARSDIMRGQCVADSHVAHSNRQAVSTHAYLRLGQSEHYFPLSHALVTIGRHYTCTISLADMDRAQRISRWHAHIRYENGQFRLYDGYDGQESKGGTWVDGQRVTTHYGHPLRPQDAIVLGRPQRKDPRLPVEGGIQLTFHTGTPLR